MIGFGVPILVLIIIALSCYLLFVQIGVCELTKLIFIGECAIAAGLIFLSVMQGHYMGLYLELKESAQEGIQAAFSEAGYQNPVDDAFLYRGEVVVIDKPVLSSDGSEIAPAGSISYYISDDCQTVRIYKDGVEIAAVNGEGV